MRPGRASNLGRAEWGSACFIRGFSWQVAAGRRKTLVFFRPLVTGAWVLGFSHFWGDHLQRHPTYYRGRLQHPASPGVGFRVPRWIPKVGVPGFMRKIMILEISSHFSAQGGEILRCFLISLGSGRIPEENWARLAEIRCFFECPLEKSQILCDFRRFLPGSKETFRVGRWGGWWLTRVGDFQLKNEPLVFNMEKGFFEVDFKFFEFLMIFRDFCQSRRKKSSFGLWGGRWLQKLLDFQLQFGPQVFNIEKGFFEVDFRF